MRLACVGTLGGREDETNTVQGAVEVTDQHQQAFGQGAVRRDESFFLLMSK